MTAFAPCAVIPTHNHSAALPDMLTQLERQGLPVIVVDDGSDPETARLIYAACEGRSTVKHLRLPFNGGKGFAVMCGMARAHELGFTHAAQIDADGQHDLAAVGNLLTVGRTNPCAIVAGTPVYDATMPRLRRFWRPLTNVWVRINTLSGRIKDAMCGFRLYPVQSTLELVRSSVAARGMDFDIEVLVKAHWAGRPIVNVPVHVTYPEGNLSNFDVVRDNIRLSLTHARLFFGMIVRAPRLVLHPTPKGSLPASADGWAGMQERGAYWGLLILGFVYRMLGRRVCLAVMFPVIAYFFLTGRTQRRCSRDYLLRAWKSGYLARAPNTLTSFRHFLAFGSSLLDRLAAWSGSVPLATIDSQSLATLDDVARGPRGAYVITAHIGNPDVIRAVATLSGRAVINVVMHTANAQLFNRLIRKFSSDVHVKIISATNMGPETAILLSQMIANGEWVVVSGDRLPPGDRSRIMNVRFLGDMAPFGHGPFLLGSILKAPCYLLFGLRTKKGYRVHFTPFADPIELPRNERIARLSNYGNAFARALEGCVAAAPLQWFNFFPFWNETGQEQRTYLARTQAAE